MLAVSESHPTRACPEELSQNRCFSRRWQSEDVDATGCGRRLRNCLVLGAKAASNVDRRHGNRPWQSRRLWMRTFRFGVLAALASVVAAVAAGGVSAASDVVGQLYVNDNTAGVNTVAGFDRHADGSLTPIAGSPFAIGGAGTGHGVASQGSLQLSADGRYLLAVDAGSNQISVLRIKPHGSAAGRRRRLLERRQPGQHRRLRRPRLRRERGPATAHRTTPASRSTPAATCARSRARPSRWRTPPSPATSCSTATGRSSSARASTPR